MDDVSALTSFLVPFSLKGHLKIFQTQGLLSLRKLLRSEAKEIELTENLNTKWVRSVLHGRYRPDET